MKIEKNLVKMKPTSEIINDSAKLFLAAQEKSIPVIRIGLPINENMPSIYPENLAQVVIAEALFIKINSGECEFHLPKKWETSWNLALRKSEKSGINRLLGLFTEIDGFS